VTSSVDKKGIYALTSEPKDEVNIFMEGDDVKGKGYFLLDFDPPFNGTVGLWKARGERLGE